MPGTKFSDLLGLTLVGVTGATKDSDEIKFVASDGRTFTMFHRSDCCESVSVADVIGNVDDLIGSPILKADEATSDEYLSDAKKPDYTDSFTWTFYTLATVKGYVTLRWLGESNGYYSESVDFEERT